jgi:hypothetical protein
VCVFSFVKTCASTKLKWKEEDLQIRAIKPETKSSTLIILSLYKAPTGDFNQFIEKI